MPNLSNAKKALRQDIARAERNQLERAKIEFMRRSFRKLVEAKKFEEADKHMSNLYQTLDKAVTKHILKPNTVDRIKSRAMKTLAKARK